MSKLERLATPMTLCQAPSSFAIMCDTRMEKSASLHWRGKGGKEGNEAETEARGGVTKEPDMKPFPLPTLTTSELPSFSFAAVVT